MHHVSVSSMEGEAAVLEVLFTALMDVGTEGRRSVLSPPSSSSWARVVVFGTERLANLLARTSSTASSTQVPAQYGGGGSSSGSSCEGVGRARFLVEGNSRPASWSPSACETSVLGLGSRAISSRRRCSVSSASASRSRSRSLGLEVGEDGEEDERGSEGGEVEFGIGADFRISRCCTCVLGLCRRRGCVCLGACIVQGTVGAFEQSIDLDIFILAECPSFVRS